MAHSVRVVARISEVLYIYSAQNSVQNSSQDWSAQCYPMLRTGVHSAIYVTDWSAQCYLWYGCRSIRPKTNSPQPTRPIFMPTRPNQLAPHLYQLAPHISGESWQEHGASS